MDSVLWNLGILRISHSNFFTQGLWNFLSFFFFYIIMIEFSMTGKGDNTILIFKVFRMITLRLMAVFSSFWLQSSESFLHLVLVVRTTYHLGFNDCLQLHSASLTLAMTVLTSVIPVQAYSCGVSWGRRPAAGLLGTRCNLSTGRGCCGLLGLDWIGGGASAFRGAVKC